MKGLSKVKDQKRVKERDGPLAVARGQSRKEI